MILSWAWYTLVKVSWLTISPSCRMIRLTLAVKPGCPGFFAFQASRNPDSMMCSYVGVAGGLPGGLPGVARFFGPTGGYLIAYPAAAGLAR